MDPAPWYKRWAVWRRVLAFASAALVLVPQYFVLTDNWARGVSFAIALIGLAISFIPDEPSKSVAVRAVRGLMDK